MSLFQVCWCGIVLGSWYCLTLNSTEGLAKYCETLMPTFMKLKGFCILQISVEGFHTFQTERVLISSPLFSLVTTNFQICKFGTSSYDQENYNFLRTLVSEKEDATSLPVTALPWFWELTRGNEASWMLFPNSTPPLFYPTKFNLSEVWTERVREDSEE